MLDLASSEAGQLRIVRQPLDLAEVLRVAAATGQQMAQANPQLVQQAQQMMQDGPKQIQKIQSKPSIEQVFTFLEDNRARAFVLDIETDSTIQLDDAAEKQQRGEFMQMMGALLPQLSAMVSSQPKAARFAGDLLKFSLDDSPLIAAAVVATAVPVPHSATVSGLRSTTRDTAYVLLAAIFSALVAFNLAFFRHLRREYASPR